MALSDDLDGFFSDFAVDVSSGGTSGKGVLDEPSSLIAGDQILYTDYLLHCRNSEFGTLKNGDTVTIKNAAGKDIDYTVRQNEAGLDGLTREISLQKT